MSKNIILGWAASLMVVADFILTRLAAFEYNEIAGWGFGTIGISFFAVAWALSTLKGRA